MGFRGRRKVTAVATEWAMVVRGVVGREEPLLRGGDKCKWLLRGWLQGIGVAGIRIYIYVS